jgi:hypothetical protein
MYWMHGSDQYKRLWSIGQERQKSLWRNGWNRHLQFIERGPDILDTWLKSQTDILENWGKSQKDFLETRIESTKNFQRVFLAMADFKEGSEASRLFNSWCSTFHESCKTLTDELMNIQDKWKTTVEKQIEKNGKWQKASLQF